MLRQGLKRPKTSTVALNLPFRMIINCSLLSLSNLVKACLSYTSSLFLCSAHGFTDDGEWDFSEAKCEIRVILAAGGETFPFSKTLPNKNCIRSKADANTVEKGLLMPTPFYNASLRSECSLLAYSDFLAGASSKSEGFRDACLLGSVWLRQRGLGTGSTSGGYGPFEWACTMALLMLKDVEGKSILSRGYSSYQLFKATLQFLSLEDLAASPYFIKHECLTLENHDQPVLFDGSRCMNLLFKMTPWSYASLRHEAGLALRLLSNPLPDRFDACFITKIDDPFQRFDCVINLPTSQFQSSASKQIDATDDQIVFCRQLYQALRIGLADRVKLIHLKPPQVTPWGPAPSNVSVEISSKIQIGLLLNPEQLNRIVDRGPSAEEKEAASTFRKFWGEKAELRRFKDGSILESLTWSVSGPKNSILMQIITHIIRRHIGDKEADGLEILGESFDDLIARKKLAASDALALYQPIMGAFTILEKQMRDLEGLPLQIRQISAADPQLRYASFKAPILDPIKSQREPANIHIQFEGSARWPDDLTAVQKTKIAFLLKIGELMAESTAGLTARLGLENTNRKILNGAFLDIFYPSGALFRLRIHHECEISMLERALKGKSPTSNPREETAFALSTYKRNFNQSALFTQAIQTLSTRFPLLSSSMRLMKKWRDCHLLSYHISDELVELLTIRTFVHPYPWSVPGSVMTGFLRTLRFISKWDWRYEPLIVDFNGEMSSAEIDAIHLRFEAWRKIDPAMNRVIMFAASSLDPVGVTWTEQGPSKVVAARFTSLAKLAIGTMRAQGTNVEPQTLFAASLADYDFVVHLTPKLAKDKQAQEKKESVFKNMQVQFNEDEGIAGFNPVRIFLSELRAMYGSSVLFFDNACQGPFIAGLWNPQTGPRPWKVNVKYSTIPTVHAGQDDAELSINKAATLHDIARLGGDMVSKVEAKR